MKTIILIISIMVFAGQAQAADWTTTWDAPTTNADGSKPLDDLDGYIVYWGTVQGKPDHMQDVGNVTTTIISVPDDGLTYYSVVTAYDTSGNESDVSKEISRTTVYIDKTCPSNPSGYQTVVK